MTTPLLDLLDAATEARVANPQLKSSVLAALRLAAASGLVLGGRLLTLGPNGEPREIIVCGESSQSDEADRELVAAVRGERSLRHLGRVSAVPLGKGKRLFGVLLLEQAGPEVCALLGDLFLQWCAQAEFARQEREELVDENYQLREELRVQVNERNIVAVSGSFSRVLESAHRVAASTATVLIHGETGTGKELIARLIHERSARANGPFITVNCGALAESLLESELFGHVKGAFTGAVNDRKGKFEAAQGGTIFLDEIGEVSQAMQVRLLRVLQEMEIERVGDNRTRKLDVRVVAATNRRLEQEVERGAFRADLFYRLNVVYLQIPPLRNRVEDIPHLAEFFLNRFCERNTRFIEAVSPEVMAILCRYRWPGNVRELENCIEKMVVMAPGRKLTPDLLPLAIMAHDPGQEADRAQGQATFEARLQAWMKSEVQQALGAGAGDLYDQVRVKWERYLFQACLEASGDNKSRAASILGITRNTLALRLKELSEERREWRVD